MEKLPVPSRRLFVRHLIRAVLLQTFFNLFRCQPASPASRRVSASSGAQSHSSGSGEGGLFPLLALQGIDRFMSSLSMARRSCVGVALGNNDATARTTANRHTYEFVTMEIG